MNAVISYFLNRSFFVNFVTVVLILAGVVSFMNLRREDFPNVDMDNIIVRVTLPGATAEDIEKLISISIERELREVDGINELDVMSGPGFSISSIKVEAGFDTDDVLTDVRTAVGGIGDFPEDTLDPVYTKFEYRLKPIIRIAITGSTERERKEFSRALRDDLEDVSGVSRIDVIGNREYILDVQVNPVLLNKYELTLSDVSRAIADRNIDVSGGKIDLATESVVIRTVKETKTTVDIEQIVLRSNDTGKQVLIKDIATVKDTFKDDDLIRRFYDKRASILNVKSKDKADTIDVVDTVKERLDTFFKEKSEGKFTHVYFDDASFYIKRRLSVLGKNAIQGIILVFLALLAFLNFRVSVITLLGAPLAFTVSFIVMYMLGITINLISMFGLILVLGMLVDDSIIVAENFYQYIEKGMEPKAAAKKAALETLGPVTGTILTTMVAFGALLFIGGTMGKFIVVVPTVVIICLAASWFECFFFLPSHLADFVKPGGKAEKSRWYEPMLRFYSFIIKKAINFYPLTILAFLILFAASLFVGKSMPFQLFPADEVRLSFVNIKGPKGSTLEATDKAVSGISKSISDYFGKDKLLGIESMTGIQLLKQGSARTGNHYGAFRIFFDIEHITGKQVNERLEKVEGIIEKAYPEYSATIEKITGGPPKGKPLNIELTGNSLKDLNSAADRILIEVKKIDGIISPDKDYEEGDNQFIVDINEKEARRLGLSNQEIAYEVRRSFEGIEASEIRYSDEDVNILVRLNKGARSSLKTLDHIFIRNSSGRRIPLKRVVTVKKNKGIYVIRRKNRKRVVSVFADIDENKLTSVSINKNVTPLVKNILEDYPDLSYNLAGESKDTSGLMSDFKVAATFAAICILFILVSLFNGVAQPMMVMMAIPLGLIGVVWVFYFLEMPIGFMALMGIIGLIGVVVNDSIVLVTFIDKKFVETKDLLTSVVDGCISRFRAVILTTFTTVAGLLPLAHAPGGDPFLKPMAISFAYGLIFSTTLTLIFVPCTYFAYYRMKDWFKRKLRMV